MANEKDLLWALSTPVPDKIFFSTDAFYDIISLHTQQKKLNQGPLTRIERKTTVTVYL
jgi:hypothetical protein